MISGLVRCCMRNEKLYNQRIKSPTDIAYKTCRNKSNNSVLQKIVTMQKDLMFINLTLNKHGKQFDIYKIKMILLYHFYFVYIKLMDDHN